MEERKDSAGAQRRESQLREVLAELWSRRIRVAGLHSYEFVIPVDAELAHRVRKAFVDLMEFGGQTGEPPQDGDAPAR
ncbi:MAG: hypothetical protein ACP5TV_02805 [Anaerolineae bacterium]